MSVIRFEFGFIKTISHYAKTLIMIRPHIKVIRLYYHKNRISEWKDYFDEL